MTGLVLIASLNAASGYDAVLIGDTYVDTTTAKPKNNGVATSMTVSGAIPKGSVVGAPALVSLVKFDLGSLPAGTVSSQIKSATLTVYVNKLTFASKSTTTATVSVFPVTVGNWTEFASPTITGTKNTVPVNGTPLTISGTALSSAPLVAATTTRSSSQGSYLTFDVSAQVRTWLDTPTSDLGLALETSDGVTVILDSKESTTTGHAAVMELELVSNGLQGPTGSQGPIGPQGNIGPVGPQGNTGPQGNVGPQGPTGNTGMTGSTGNTGNTGSQGNVGPAGPTGPQGSAGSPSDLATSPVPVPLLQWIKPTVTTIPTNNTFSYNVCFDGTYIWATNYLSGSVSKINATTGVVAATISLSPNTGASGICFDGTHIWVANATSGKVSEITPNSTASGGTVTATITVGANPIGICFDGAYIWVVNSSTTGTVSKINATTNAVTGPVTVGQTPSNACFDGTHIWVTNFNNTVSEITPTSDAAGGTVIKTVTVGTNPYGICFDGTNIWVTNFGANTVTKIVAGSATVSGSAINVGAGPEGICFDGTNIWVANFNSGANGTVNRIDTVTNAVILTVPLVNGPSGICFDGTHIWTGNPGSATNGGTVSEF